jgi:hypothetical protein
MTDNSPNSTYVVACDSILRYLTFEPFDLDPVDTLDTLVPAIRFPLIQHFSLYNEAPPHWLFP